MIVEGVATTLDAGGRLNVAPMGPLVEEADGVDFRRLTFRPFPTSRTYANLKATGCGVFHVVDDALLIANALLDRANDAATVPAEKIAGRRLTDCCRYYEFTVEMVDETGERPRFVAKIVHTARVRDFWGFNRAKHAVLELAVLTSRVRMLPADHLRAELDRLRIPVEKTAGARERLAFALLEAHLQQVWKAADAER